MAQYLSVLELSSLDGTNGFRLDGHRHDLSGRASSGAGDVNGDGFADLIIGALGAGGGYLVFGGADGFAATSALGKLDGNNGFQIDSEVPGAAVGFSVSGAGDVNGDGFDDVILGSRAADPNGTDSGASYVVFGKASGFPATLGLLSLDGSNGFKINGEAAHDYGGGEVCQAGDVNGDGFADLIVGAIGADPSGSNSGAAYVVFGKAFGFAATLELSSLDGHNGFQINGEAAGDRSGRSAASAGDVNGDGFGDLIVGADDADPNGDFSGASYVIFGTESGFGATLELSSLDGNNGFQINGEEAIDTSGRYVSSGDVNGDGFTDLVIGAVQAHPNGSSSGAVYVVFGKASGFAANLELSSLDGNNGFKINGETAQDRFGKVSSMGDFNGDGFDDIIVGAYDASPNGHFSGAAYVVFGKASGFAATLELSSLHGNDGFQINGESEDDRVGFSASSAGDVNGDGFADLLVGAPYADTHGPHSGASYVIFGGMPGKAVTRTGTDIANTIHGGNFDDVLNGLGGDDTLIGHDGNDQLSGGAGDDALIGGAGRDALVGDEGVDTFTYETASDATSASFDKIKACDFAEDAFDTAAAVSGIDATIGMGQLNGSTFDADLAAAAAGHLGVGHAVLFTPDSGNKAGKTFLIVDQNGTAGYQAGADLIIKLVDALSLGSIDTGDFI